MIVNEYWAMRTINHKSVTFNLFTITFVCCGWLLKKKYNFEFVFIFTFNYLFLIWFRFCCCFGFFLGGGEFGDLSLLLKW